MKSVSWGGARTKGEVHKRELTKNMFLHSDLLTSLTSSLTQLFLGLEKSRCEVIRQKDRELLTNQIVLYTYLTYVKPCQNILEQFWTNLKLCQIWLTDKSHLRIRLKCCYAFQRYSIPSCSSIKQGASQQPVALRVYNSDHHPTRQSASDSQDKSHSPPSSIPVKFSGWQRKFELIVIYDSLEALGTLRVHQVLPLDRSDRNVSVYVSSDWSILVDYLIFPIHFEIFSTVERFNWTVRVVCLIFLNHFENFFLLRAI